MAVNQKAVKVLNKILEAGFTDEKAINDLQKSIKANKVISFLAAMRMNDPK